MSNDAPAKKSKPNFLKILIIFIAGVIVMTTAATNLLVVYVLFAPDTLPKPIYLVYQLPSGATTQAGGAASGAAQPGVEAGSANPIAIITGKPGAASAAAEPAAASAQTPEAAEAKTTKESNTSSAGVEPGQGIMVDTSTKIVNLAEPGGKKFIRVTATLEFAPPAGYAAMAEEAKAAALTTFTTEINAKVPILDDTIVTILSSKDFQSVYTTEGKDALRKEIMDAVNTKLPEYQVIYVYFKEFVMQ